MDIKTILKVVLGILLTVQFILIIIQFFQCNLCDYCWRVISLFLIFVGYFTLWKEDFLVTVAFAIAELASSALAMLIFCLIWQTAGSLVIVVASFALAMAIYRQERLLKRRVDQIL